MLLAEVVATSAVVAATSSRSAKRDVLADLLERAEPHEVEPLIGLLVGEPRQGRFGVGWRTLASARQQPASLATITVTDLDTTLSRLARLGGPGSATERRDLLAELLSRSTPEEADFLARLVGGELRQGALAGVVTDAVARAAGVPATVVRRAVMLGGRLDVVASLALSGGRDALAAVGLEVGRPVQPMLASTAASVEQAVTEIGLAAVEWKLDGIRVQVHRNGDKVRAWTRNLNEITDRVPEVVTAVRGLDADRLVLDGEAIALDPGGHPLLFQDTVSGEGGGQMRPFFFDLLHLDGRDLIDEPLAERRQLLADIAGEWHVPGAITADPDSAATVLDDALQSGHEGVVVKAADSRYEAGRRGKTWRKVKPVHTFDLVVLAAEWGHGRRQGWLSNLHLGARNDYFSGAGPSPQGSEFVMVGKTFKGLTDELLRWQTERFLSLAEREEPWDGPQTGVVWVRPEQVVEIAIDGIQRSTRYPGGLALRFARVVRYRDDKAPSDADTLSALRDLGTT